MAALCLSFATNLYGWGANLDCALHKRKAYLLRNIKSLDDEADAVGLSKSEWGSCYFHEQEMEFILYCEEIYWQQRGRQQWIVEGGSNTTFFHATTNGRCRRCRILVLNDGQNMISDPSCIQEHIYSFYKDLLGSSGRGGTSMAHNIWSSVLVSHEDNLALTAPFLMS